MLHPDFDPDPKTLWIHRCGYVSKCKKPQCRERATLIAEKVDGAGGFEPALTQRCPNGIPRHPNGEEERTMRRSASFLAVLMFSILMTVLLADLSSAVAGGGNCQDKLVGKAYDCTEKESNGMTASVCWEFATGGFSSNFDLYLDVTTDYGCACQGTGSFKSPSFNASSNKFECVGKSIYFEWQGKVSSNKISGQGLAATGETLFFSCTERSSPC